MQGQVRPGLESSGATYARQKEFGIIPANAELTPRDPAFPAWDSLPPDQKKLYARQMEVYAGFRKRPTTRWDVGVKSIEDQGIADNTLIIYIFGDNGSSMEVTETGTFNEITMFKGVPLPARAATPADREYGGINGRGGPNAIPISPPLGLGRQHAVPVGKAGRLSLRGTRDPLVVSGRNVLRIRPAGALSSLIDHVVPTISRLAGFPAPKKVNGTAQIPMHGWSFAQHVR